MSRFAVILGVAASLTAPASAVAKDKMEPRAQAMLACATVTPDAARLRCFDQSVLQLSQALDKGDLVVNESKKPLAFDGAVAASGRMGGNDYWVQLSNGERWQLTPEVARSQAPPVGEQLKIRKGVFGNYWISSQSWNESKARYLGRR